MLNKIIDNLSAKLDAHIEDLVDICMPRFYVVESNEATYAVLARSKEIVQQEFSGKDIVLDAPFSTAESYSFNEYHQIDVNDLDHRALHMSKNDYEVLALKFKAYNFQSA